MTMTKKIQQNECMIGAASNGRAGSMSLREAICFPLWLANELHGPETGQERRDMTEISCIHIR